jgi:hypothetical protein
VLFYSAAQNLYPSSCSFKSTNLKEPTTFHIILLFYCFFPENANFIDLIPSYIRWLGKNHKPKINFPQKQYFTKHKMLFSRLMTNTMH